MTGIKREPAPPGPIASLYERLDELHLGAGLPSMRDISARASHQVSSSTVHNVFAFRNSRLPKWPFLEAIVKALGGDPAVFLGLWKAAAQAENNAIGPSAPMSEDAAPGPAETSWPRPAPPVPHQGIWSPEIPSRNSNFTGRVAELQELRANLISRTQPTPPVQVILGMGGVGKTEIATEYAHLHRMDYDIIWWIRAEQPDRVPDALVNLGERLDLRLATANGRDRAIKAVLDALQAGVRPNWLLVYDNVAEPLQLQPYLPACPPGGHVIITARLPAWPGYIEADTIEVSPFTADEAVSFLRRRVHSLAADRRLAARDDEERIDQAERLAATLGHLPIAIEHAAAYLNETNQSVDDYLGQFDRNAHQLLSEQPSELPESVSRTWTMSTALLTEDAQHLFNLCAFFSPEPISCELLLENAKAVTDPPGLRELLSSSPRFRAASSQLRRLSLVKVDGAKDQIQLHRVVQAATRSQLRQYRYDLFLAYRSAVDTVLAASNPGNPDRAANDVVYDLSLQHLESDRDFLNTGDPALRRLIIDQIRRLQMRGSHTEATRFGQEALKVWRERLGDEHLDVLTLAVEVAIAMRSDAHAANARDLIRDTLRILKERYGEDHEVTLLCNNTHGADLRSGGQLAEALDLDLSLLPRFERVFGTDHTRTMNVRNNIAADYRRLGRHEEALQTDRQTYRDRENKLGPDDPVTLGSLDSVSRDLRDLGRYQESLDVARKVVEGFAANRAGENLYWLNARKSFAVALRKAGYHWEALHESEEVFQRYRDYLGLHHTYTLRAATNLVNDRRAVGELAQAEVLGREVEEQCQTVRSPSDLSYAAQVSLASVLRAAGQLAEATRFDRRARDGLVNAYGDVHPFSLEATINYASDLAAGDDLAGAIQIGHETMESCWASLGQDHPVTLMATANLALDEAAAGNAAVAETLLSGALRRYADLLTTEHPEARAAAARKRLTAEIEPY
ncbi:MAG: tetratricopeptide repeat protein [Actinobacteria bacterium]|nr:tetratricopeptide repeat protein [Actinomycetota bacterium]